MKNLNRILRVAVIPALLSLAAPRPATAELARIGAAGAVQGKVNATAPGAVGRVISSGKSLFLNDHVTTDDKGRLQVMLLDETIFTLGPDSDMVLDEFVYDPATSAGKVTARVTKGVFRFVTGKIARKKPASMKVKLPVGTIGIRGTMAAGKVDAQGATIILLGPGADNNAGEGAGSISVENAGKTVLINRAGYGTTIAPGQPPAAVTEMSRQAAEISASLAPKAASKPTKALKTTASGGTKKTLITKAADISETAGQETAAAGETLVASIDTAELAADLNTSLDDATDDTKKSEDDVETSPVVESDPDPDPGPTFADGTSTWDEVRTIPSGIGTYFGEGTYTGTGALSGGGDMVFRLNVDFGARTFGGGGGGGSYLALMTHEISTDLYLNSFDALSGNAIITLDGVINCDPNFAGTELTFENAGNVAAKNVKVDLLYDDFTGSTASGTLTAPRTGP